MYELYEADILIKILNGYVSAISCVTYEEFRNLYSHFALSGWIQISRKLYGTFVVTMRETNKDSSFIFSSMSVNFHLKGKEDGKIGLRLGLKMLEGLSVDESGSGSCPVVDFGKRNVNLSASVTSVIIYVLLVKLTNCRSQHRWWKFLIQTSLKTVGYF